MTFDEANALLDEIVAFLIACGGPYKHTTPHLERLVLFSLATGQYLLDRDESGIRWFVHWVRIRPDDIEGLSSINEDEQVFPADLVSGPILYLANMASRCGTGDMKQALRKIEHTGRLWHRFERGPKYFPHHGGRHG